MTHTEVTDTEAAGIRTVAAGADRTARSPRPGPASAATSADERIHRIRRRLERLIGIAATEGNPYTPCATATRSSPRCSTPSAPPATRST